MMRPFSELPPRAEDDNGYAYLIRFTNGTVKVGFTWFPARRFDAHQSAAQAFGIEVEDWWISRQTINYESLEKQILREAERMAGVPSAREYFQGIDFDRLRGFAEAHVADLPSDEDAENDRIKRLRAAIASEDEFTLEQVAELTCVKLGHLRFNCRRRLVGTVPGRKGPVMAGSHIRRMLKDYSDGEGFSAAMFAEDFRDYRLASKRRKRANDDARRVAKTAAA